MRSSTSVQQTAVIGTGAIGGAVARRLLAAGRPVVVWNRTPERSADLVGAGARSAPSLRDAVSSSALVLITVPDYAAVQECLSQLDPDLSGRSIVVLCTGSADDARLAAREVTRRGGRYLDGGIQALPETIGTEAATIVYGGSSQAFETHRASLELLSTARFVGEAPEAAAVWDLALFGVWYDAQLGLLRALDAAREIGVDLGEFAQAARTQLGHVVTAVPTTVTEAAQATYPPGPADLTEHLTVIRHLVEMRTDRPLGEGGLSAVAERIETLIAAGRGGDGLTATLG